MTYEQVVALRPGFYDIVPRTNFVTNWKALKTRIDNNIERARKNKERYDHDMKLYTLAKDDPEEWHGSEAEALLKDDISKERHLRYSPGLLYSCTDEYQEFEYQTFRKHIHQEARSLLETPYWMVKKEKKQKKKKMIEDAIKDRLQSIEEQQQHELEDAFEVLAI